MEELIEQHMRDHVARPGLTDKEREAAAEEMLALIRRYGK
jgi:DNA-binding FrmR family transcriptional regulator